MLTYITPSRSLSVPQAFRKRVLGQKRNPGLIWLDVRLGAGSVGALVSFTERILEHLLRSLFHELR